MFLLDDVKEYLSAHNVVYGVHMSIRRRIVTKRRIDMWEGGYPLFDVPKNNPNRVRIHEKWSDRGPVSWEDTRKQVMEAVEANGGWLGGLSCSWSPCHDDKEE